MVALEPIACGCPLVVTNQVPEIVRRLSAVPVVAPYDAEGLRRRIDAALDGRAQPTDITRMADYDWSGTARRYIALYQSALRHDA